MNSQELSQTPKTDATLAVGSRLRPVEPSDGFVSSVMQRVAAHAAAEQRASNHGVNLGDNHGDNHGVNNKNNNSSHAHSRRPGGHSLLGVFAAEPRFAVAALALVCMVNMVLLFTTSTANTAAINAQFSTGDTVPSAAVQSLQLGSKVASQTSTAVTTSSTAGAEMQWGEQYYGINGAVDATAEAWYE
ncbi:MAG: hypothetical protein ACK5JL_04800 [Candidatus Kapaibacterium sp.]|jgi:hypothetical protein